MYIYNVGSNSKKYINCTFIKGQERASSSFKLNERQNSVLNIKVSHWIWQLWLSWTVVYDNPYWKKRDRTWDISNIYVVWFVSWKWENFQSTSFKRWGWLLAWPEPELDNSNCLENILYHSMSPLECLNTYQYLLKIL